MLENGEDISRRWGTRRNSTQRRGRVESKTSTSADEQEKSYDHKRYESQTVQKPIRLPRLPSALAAQNPLPCLEHHKHKWRAQPVHNPPCSIHSLIETANVSGLKSKSLKAGAKKGSARERATESGILV